MNKIILGVKFALSYFTLLPIRFNADDDLSHPRVLKSMLLSLPFVGVLLASLSIGVFSVLESLGWLGAIIAAVIYMVLYGFIHTEAVIDVADAVHAAHSGKDPYEIIKDPTVGAMGVLYGVSFTLLKIAALSTLLMHHLFLPFIAIALISRLSLLVLIRTYEFRSSFVTRLHENLRVVPLILLILLCGALGFYLLSVNFLPLFVAGVLTALLLSFLTKRSLGFINGDVLGMSLEGSELVLIITALLTCR
ncbi:cobalamin-5-phosphate synthase CobS [Sulfuricurvum kujiense DSM 16994]|uniref:Adenosylcobinamide-GDP ribazoletransferase n=1 Tax=Sulfuricurvum kujiense (strain ATCC BAA-921 / DSM 16994 / JCM 11577 / YK-1) TaxID=709032 RepID=E4TW73_SULKY|nr:adenosylcobinamide-GDP ribazoletransferase [Sulfuricurvum kujiense]ADR32689.1 cobalamin-5-phosphate synthase CobS [Sulfuricurvum kujiense DSM 16994]